VSSGADPAKPRRWSAPSALVSTLAAARRIVPRQPIDDAIDWVRYKVDSPDSLAYQPEAGSNGDRGAGGRGGGTESRWNAIWPVVQECEAKTAVDIGCNLGWFAINLGLKGVAAVGVEGHPPAYRSATYLARKSGADNVFVLAMNVSAENVSLVPHADATLCLSVWHHIVRHQGLASADAVLSQLWAGTKNVLVFETGETEMPAAYNLPPMTPNPRRWITNYLEERCPQGAVRHLGFHESAPTYSRNLFAVVRQ
jgi:SAM-dependent methyltransferase